MVSSRRPWVAVVDALRSAVIANRSTSESDRSGSPRVVATSCAASASARRWSASLALLIAKTVPAAATSAPTTLTATRMRRRRLARSCVCNWVSDVSTAASMKSRSRSERSGVASATHASAAARRAPAVELPFVTTELGPGGRGRGQVTMYADAVTIVIDP